MEQLLMNGTIIYFDKSTSYVLSTNLLKNILGNKQALHYTISFDNIHLYGECHTLHKQTLQQYDTLYKNMLYTKYIKVTNSYFIESTVLPPIILLCIISKINCLLYYLTF